LGKNKHTVIHNSDGLFSIREYISLAYKKPLLPQVYGLIKGMPMQSIMERKYLFEIYCKATSTDVYIPGDLCPSFPHKTVDFSKKSID
jgi:hypothetical protein